MREQWEELEEFPEYLVSNYGNVYHTKAGTEKHIWFNQQGVASVTLFHKGRAANRSVALLVAKTFLKPDEERFNTPIHLDGNRANCRQTNLLWRPRPFAIEYHRQFGLDHFQDHILTEIVQTGERFRYIWEPAMTYGLLARVILSSCHTGDEVFPTGHVFRFI